MAKLTASKCIWKGVLEFEGVETSIWHRVILTPGDDDNYPNLVVEKASVVDSLGALRWDECCTGCCDESLWRAYIAQAILALL